MLAWPVYLTRNPRPTDRLQPQGSADLLCGIFRIPALSQTEGSLTASVFQLRTYHCPESVTQPPAANRARLHDAACRGPPGSKSLLPFARLAEGEWMYPGRHPGPAN